MNRDFPGGPVVKNSPPDAGDTGSNPGQRTKISHTLGQLSLHAATREKPCTAAKSPQDITLPPKKNHNKINKIKIKNEDIYIYN